MMRTCCEGRVCKLLVAGLLVVTAASLSGQSGAKNGEWPTYGGDLGNTRYSSLDQINASNFSKLNIAWRFKTDSLGPHPDYMYEVTPLMVKGVLYATGGSRRAVFALDATTGELLWVHREDEGARGAGAPKQFSGRGVAYWTDGKEERILYVTLGYRLVTLDAKTGIPVAGFGEKGAVDLKRDDDQEIKEVDRIHGLIGLHGPPIVIGDVVVVGAKVGDTGGVPPSRKNVKGYIRGYDVRTGKRLWIFHTIPQPGEFGNDTWLNDSWSYTGNAGVWSQISADQELGIVYLPIELPTGDIFGANRPGNGLFGESLVAVDVKTGQRKWHYQLAHHGIWDMDIPSAPILTDITINGRLVKAVAQPTKQAFLYVFDRATGQPIWPIEERPVPKGDVPGEWYSATQPFPTKPPAFDRNGVTIDDLIDFTPELRQEAVKLVSKYKLGPVFTPPVVSKAEGPLATLTLGAPSGGANWPGGSYDPETHILYVFSRSTIAPLGLVPPADEKVSDMQFVKGGAGKMTLSVQGLPLVKPPYGRITAIDMNQGEILWQIAHGETPDNIRNHPALQGLNIPRTGRQGFIGTLVTKTLLIAGEAGMATTPSGQRGAMLRAYDKRTGSEVGAVFMPAPQSGSPMTYAVNGHQYVVLAIGDKGGELIAFRLPDDAAAPGRN